LQQQPELKGNARAEWVVVNGCQGWRGRSAIFALVFGDDRPEPSGRGQGVERRHYLPWQWREAISGLGVSEDPLDNAKRVTLRRERFSVGDHPERLAKVTGSRLPFLRRGGEPALQLGQQIQNFSKRARRDKMPLGVGQCVHKPLNTFGGRIVVQANHFA
jgi:hypothetical protein